MIAPSRKGEQSMKVPKWLERLLASVCDACVNDVKGRMSGLSYRWAKPEDNSWGTWLLQIAPSVIEIVGGKDDGETVFDFVDVDLLALPQCLDEVETFAHDPDFGNVPRLAPTPCDPSASINRRCPMPTLYGSWCRKIPDISTHSSWRHFSVVAETSSGFSSN
jgi:hypothetical protein